MEKRRKEGKEGLVDGARKELVTERWREVRKEQREGGKKVDRRKECRESEKGIRTEGRREERMRYR